jgi:maltooligosyltrehalose trehalohydrolase
MKDTVHDRRLPVGAELTADGVRFRVWAPRHSRVELFLEAGPGAPATVPLTPEPGGFHSGLVRDAAAGTLYRYGWDGDDALFPDPASRFQPDGPHGPSLVVDPDAYAWRDGSWRGISASGQVVYELHIGCFTPEGTWRAAEEQLDALADLGVTVLELMPVAEFAGRFGWGYDGVDLFAPSHLYGTPDDFRRFVDRAHALGLGVILDVVYNHLGPDGNFLARFSDDYFTDEETEWGEAINFDGPGSAPVREFFTANAAYWIREFHLDGLRLDATQSIHDRSRGRDHILAEITRAARAAAGERRVYLVAENEPQEARLVRPQQGGGYGMDALWNDDFHHAAMVALIGRNEAYYTDYLGTPQEFVSAAKWGFLYQGQHYLWQRKRRGMTALDLPPQAFVSFIQNHDQVANSGRGERIHLLTSPGRLRAMTALLLLGPATPMLFMGQEFGASSPFLYFADHEPELARAVSRGRREFLRQFPSLAQVDLPEPADVETFRRCVLDLSEREKHAELLALHRDLLRLRREDRVLPVLARGAVDGAVLGGDAFVLRYFGGEAGDRLLLVNLGRDLRFAPAPEPLLASLDGRPWRVLWCSEDPRYGGNGAPEPESPDGGWQIPGEAAVFLTSEE